MFREKEIIEAVKTAYSYLFPEKKERRKMLRRLDLPLLAQAVRYRAETPLAYQTTGSAELSLNYQGPELFRQRACPIFHETIQHHSTLIEAMYIRELWLLEDGTFSEVSAVVVHYLTATEKYYTCYRTVRGTVEGKDWSAYDPEDIAEALEDFCKYPFDAEPITLLEV